MIRYIKKKLNSQSLNVKLNISILLCVVVVFFCLIYLVTKYSKPIIEEQIENLAKKSVNAYVFDFNHLLRDTEQIVTHTKNTLSQISETDISSIQMLLNSSVKTVYHSELDFVNTWVYVFSPDNIQKGTLYKSKNNKKGETIYSTENISDLYGRFSWFREVPKEEKIFWSEPYINETGEKVITCLVPFNFLNSSKINGMVGFTVNLSSIQRSITGVSFYEQGKILIMSRSGLYVSHPDPNITLKMTIFELAKKINEPQLEIIGNELAAGKSGKKILTYSSIFDDPVIVFYAPISHINWGIALVYNKNDFLHPLYQFELLIIISFIISILLISFIINWICRRSTKQITKLNNIAEQYTNGDFSTSFDEIPSSKDIKILSNTLSQMKKNILGYIKRETQIVVEQQKNQSELEIAHDIQLSSMSTKYPDNPSFKIYSMLIPAKQVGGDFYDFFFIDDNKFAIVIADVSGKGIPASLYMMKSQTLIKNILRSTSNLENAFHQLNNELCEGNDTCIFVTSFVAIIDLTTGIMEYVNAGHTPPLLKTNNEYNYIYPKRNMVLGINKNIRYPIETIKLNHQDGIFLYTDGVTEAENVRSEFYGEERLKSILKNSSLDPKKNLNIVLNDIKKFSKNTYQSDDIAMLEFIYLENNKNTFKISADIQKLYDVLNFIENDALRKKLSDETKFKIIMISEEIFSNICQHAYIRPKKAKITINTELCNDEYHITFIDRGKNYNLLEQKKPDFNIDINNRDVGGLGIHLIRELSDEIYYSHRNQQNILKIIVKLNKNK